MIHKTMYLSVSCIYLLLYSVIISEPIMLNFVFIWFALVASSIYHDYRPILFASFLTASFTSYCFYAYHEQIFPGSSTIEVYYFLLMDIFITIILITTSNFAEGLRLKAERNEHEAVEELRKTKEYLESFVNNTTDAIDVIDLEGTVLRVNKAFETIFGWSGVEMVEQKINKIIPTEVAHDTWEMWKKVQQGEQVTGFEALRKRKDGSLLTASVTISPIRDETGQIVAFATISRDITERLKTHDLLCVSEKLSVVGQLAAGVAHEIRNPLTTIKGFIQLMQGNLNNDNAHYLEIVLSEVNRINLIVSEFLILAKPQVTKHAQQNVLNILQEVITLVNPQAVINNIQIETDYSPDIPLIDCDEGHLKQVFINLIKNAIEAMDLSGTITIRVEANSKQVIIQIIDQGCGIPAEQISLLGKPFFSTKGNGNGLGLMVSQRIIAQHKGSISYQSVLHRGTCVEVRLPISADKDGTLA